MPLRIPQHFLNVWELYPLCPGQIPQELGLYIWVQNPLPSPTFISEVISTSLLGLHLV
uniref:Uncharacterized protein n=1 Tax=Anguilla anguilla TaxID=7936 RepID=A0A0E9XG65_ANGAN